MRLSLSLLNLLPLLISPVFPSNCIFSNVNFIHILNIRVLSSHLQTLLFRFSALRQRLDVVLHCVVDKLVLCLCLHHP